MSKLTFEEFRLIVLAEWPDAANGRFSIPTGLAPTRTIYEWRYSHAAIVYDSNDALPWYVDNGRGVGCFGASFEAANKEEAKKYDAGYLEFSNR